MTVLIDAEKASDKILQTFMIKAVSKIGIERNFFNLLRGIYKQATDNILVNNERLSIFSTLRLGSILLLGFPSGSDGKESQSAVQETWVPCLDQEDPLEMGMATHTSVLAWRIPWTEEPGRLQSMESQRVGHD